MSCGSISVLYLSPGTSWCVSERRVRKAQALKSRSWTLGLPGSDAQFSTKISRLRALRNSLGRLHLSTSPQGFPACVWSALGIWSGVVRRFASLLLFTVLLLRAIVPALPIFVCVQMGGMHSLKPCCSSDDEHVEAGATVSARCCQSEAQHQLDLQSESRPELQKKLLAVAQLATVPLHEPWIVPSGVRPKPACNGPPPIGPPPPLHQVLRI
jgi:hypothetical protein